MASTGEPKQSRIPVPLQMIFLHSNRGHDVDRPPPARVASRIFPRGLFVKKPVHVAVVDNVAPKTCSLERGCKGAASDKGVGRGETSPHAKDRFMCHNDRSKTSIADGESEDESEVEIVAAMAKDIPLTTEIAHVPSCGRAAHTNMMRKDALKYNVDDSDQITDVQNEMTYAKSTMHRGIQCGRNTDANDDSGDETETEYDKDDQGEDTNHNDMTNYDSCSDVLFETYEAEMEELLKLMDRRVESTRRFDSKP